MNSKRPSAIAGLLVLLLTSTHGFAGMVSHQPDKSACQFTSTGHYIRVGGIRQWLAIKGKDCQNPIILMVHGGPGSPLSLYHDSLFKDWENDFTIVHWDQRDSGKTFQINHPESQSFEQLLGEPLTVDRLVDDGLMVTDYIRKHYKADKVILMGTSWGAFLALKMATVAPEKYVAYLGSSPLINFEKNTLSSYQQVLLASKKQQNQAAIAVLNDIGVPPWKSLKSFKQLRMLIRQYENQHVQALPMNIDKNYADSLSRQAYRMGEDVSFVKFLGRNNDGMANDVQLDACCLVYQLPIHLFQGQYDLLSTPEVTRAFFKQLSAPEKTYTVVPQAGHELNQALLDKQFERLKQLSL